jgi:hypothetical protein
VPGTRSGCEGGIEWTGAQRPEAIGTDGIIGPGVIAPWLWASPLQFIERDWQVAHVLAGRVVDRVSDCCRETANADFAKPLDADGLTMSFGSSTKMTLIPTTDVRTLSAVGQPLARGLDRRVGHLAARGASVSRFGRENASGNP